MKTLRFITIMMFAIVIMLPLLFFNLTPNSVSLIDNRKLAENPFSEEGDLTANIEMYVSDRIGFRDTMISTYIILNDKIFGKMVHPSYTYGKGGYVFGGGITTENDFGEFHIAFADMVKSIQDYCERRNIPFLFVFNPAKPAVYQDKIAEGINYNREWVDLFFSELDKREINYLDNTVTLKELSDSGIEGFNQKYDANHWNDIGAFYGTKKILERIQQSCPAVHINELTEFSVSKKQETSLLVSDFPIDEWVPEIGLEVEYTNLSKDYFSEIELDPSFQGFDYYINENRKNEGSPKVLVFQGSYMNSYGSKYLINSLGEYIYVHDYQNVIDFPYYFNIFQPDYVVFEVAEYTFTDHHFSYNNMKSIQYNPYLPLLSKEDYKEINALNEEIIVEQGDVLTKIIWKTDDVYKYVWFKLDNTLYDMKNVEGGYELTIETTRYEEAMDTSKKIFVSSYPQ